MNDTADTEVGPPGGSYSESTDVFWRAGLCPGRVNRMSKNGGNQALRSLGEDLGCSSRAPPRVRHGRLFGGRMLRPTGISLVCFRIRLCDGSGRAGIAPFSGSSDASTESDLQQKSPAMAPARHKARAPRPKTVGRSRHAWIVHDPDLHPTSDTIIASVANPRRMARPHPARCAARETRHDTWYAQRSRLPSAHPPREPAPA